MRFSLSLFLVTFLLYATSGVSLADSQIAGRAVLGLKLFRATLAADLDIHNKTTADGQLQLLVYGNDIKAKQVAEKLIRSGSVRKMPLQVKTVDDSKLATFRDHTVAGVIVASPTLSQAEFKRLSEFARIHRIIVFSPFEGGVEQGVSAGLYIRAKVLPYVNINALKRSGIRLKPFFLKVAKEYP